MAKKTLRVDRDRCIGCGECISSCPQGILEIEDMKCIAKAGCTGCGACLKRCTFEALTLVNKRKNDTE